MISQELKTVVETTVPQLAQVAQELGQTPSEVLRDFTDEVQKKLELDALDKIVADAEASGMREMKVGQWADETHAAMLKKHDIA